MPWTVADLERDLLTLDGKLLERVGLDHDTASGANGSLRIPIRKAAKRLGVAVAGSAVTDEELATLDATLDEKLLALAHLRTLELCRDNWPEFDQSSGEESQSLSQLTKALDDRIAALKAELGDLALEEDSTTLPGPAAHGLIRAGLCYPPLGANRYGYVRSGCYYAGRYYP